MIVKGYAFSYKDNNISVLNLNNPSRAILFSQDAGNAMQKSMAIVVSVGLLYSTLMTLIIVPIMYDILYRHTPKVIDVGSDLDVVPDEMEEL